MFILASYKVGGTNEWVYAHHPIALHAKDCWFEYGMLEFFVWAKLLNSTPLYNFLDKNESHGTRYYGRKETTNFMNKPD